jgi:hypothetical protein
LSDLNVSYGSIGAHENLEPDAPFSDVDPDAGSRCRAVNDNTVPFGRIP